MTIDDRRLCIIAAAIAMTTLGGCSLLSPRGAPTPLPMAFMLGEVAIDRATIWARCDQGEELIASVAPVEHHEFRAAIDPQRDYTARITLSDLEPATRYRYSLWCHGKTTANPVVGTFRTPPESFDAVPVRFAWLGDVGGQNVCRDATRGYLPFHHAWSAHAEFIIALGDMMYADSPCLETGRFGNAQIPGPATPATDIEGFRAHWRYARADRFTQRAFASTGVYAIWDDHEIENDAGPDNRLMPIARQAFDDYHPLKPGAPLYRSVRWGKHAELFILDARSYRDANSAPDGPDKTMLGTQQKRWLLTSLAGSNATWKIIVSSVPLSVPTGSEENGADGWANHTSDQGFERELSEILRSLQKLERRNVLFLTTDVHFGAAFRYVPFADDPEFVIHEMISGPLSAGIYPRDMTDDTFHPETLYLHGEPGRAQPASYEEALKLFNLGVVDIDEDGTLTTKLVNGEGTPVYELQLAPQ